MIRRILLVLAGVLVALTVYLLAWPVAIDPVAWEAPEHAGAVGPHAPNERLAELEIVDVDGLTGPEDVAIDPDGRVVTGTLEGLILRFSGEDPSPPERWVDTGGRPLGLAFGPDGFLYVADVARGLLRISPAGEIEVLATEADGVPIRYANNVDVAADGVGYLSDASTRFGPGLAGPAAAREHYQASLREIFEHGGSGRVLRWDPATGRATTVLDGLTHPNGVALTEDGTALLVNETGSYRVHRLELAGPSAGTSRVVASNLPGFPDNLTRGRDGRLWLALVSPRNDLVDRLSGRPFLRKVVQRLPQALRPDAAPFTHVVAIDAEGRVLADLQDPSGRYPFPTAVAEGERHLWLASVKTAALARVEKAAVGL